MSLFNSPQYLFYQMGIEVENKTNKQKQDHQLQLCFPNNKTDTACATHLGVQMAESQTSL